jgi:hypothetical protein
MHSSNPGRTDPMAGILVQESIRLLGGPPGPCNSIPPSSMIERARGLGASPGSTLDHEVPMSTGL